MIRVEVTFEWRPVGEVRLDARQLTFPAMPQATGLYRYRLIGATGTTAYVGESMDLRRRAYGYKLGRVKQATNARMNARMRESTWPREAGSKSRSRPRAS